MSLFTPEFISMVVGIIVSLVIAAVPQFEAVKMELIAVVTVLVGLVIAALGGERVAAARSSGATQAERVSPSYASYRYGSKSVSSPDVKSPN